MASAQTQYTHFEQNALDGATCAFRQIAVIFVVFVIGVIGAMTRLHAQCTVYDRLSREEELEADMLAILCCASNRVNDVMNTMAEIKYNTITNMLPLQCQYLLNAGYICM